MSAGGASTSIDDLQNYLTNFQNQLFNRLNSIQTNFQNEIDAINTKLNAIDQTNTDIKQITTQNNQKIKLFQDQVDDLERIVTSNFTDTKDLIKIGNKEINDVKKCVPTINQINQDIITLKTDINNKVNLSNTNQSVSQVNTNISKNQGSTNNLIVMHLITCLSKIHCHSILILWHLQHLNLMEFLNI